MKKLLLLLIFIYSVVSAFSQEYLNGADLSYTNEMEDWGAVFNENDTIKDIYSIFKQHGATVIRFRLWHTPKTVYGSFQDVMKGIERAKAAGFKVLLDFHYSDTWADPSKQLRPVAWHGITDLNILKDSVYNYTYQVVLELNSRNLMPEYIQIGNEINGNIMLEEGESLYPNDWPRNVALLQSGINAVKAVNAQSAIQAKIVIHVADPKNGNWWFSPAQTNGLTNYDIIGLSYYPEYHDYTLSQVGAAVKQLKASFNKDVWVVETGYPWTLENQDALSNILSGVSVLPGYSNPPTPKSQKAFLINLTYQVISNGGLGVVYWEPDWVSTNCSTEWGQGSAYENATFFDFSSNLLQGIDYLNYDYSVAPSTESEVTFMVDMTGIEIVDGVYVTGDFTGTAWQFMPMKSIGNNIYSYTTTIQKGSEGAYIFTIKADWDMAKYHEKVPAECAPMWGTHRKYVIENDQETYAYKWSSCETFTVGVPVNLDDQKTQIYPNPIHNQLIINKKVANASAIWVISIEGKFQQEYPASSSKIYSSGWADGIYIIKWVNGSQQVIDSAKVIKQSK